MSYTLNSEIELEVVIDYDFQPEETDTNTAQLLTINAVMLGDTDILGRLIGDELESVHQACLEDMMIGS